MVALTWRSAFGFLAVSMQCLFFVFYIKMTHNDDLEGTFHFWSPSSPAAPSHNTSPPPCPPRRRFVPAANVSSLTAAPTSPSADLLAGASADHFILTLSDSEFESLSLSTMLSHYGEAEGGGTCSSDFGNALVNRWRAARLPNCEHNSSSRPPLSVSSSIDCFLIKQTRHAGNGDNLCLLKNVSVAMSVFADQGLTVPLIKEYAESSFSKKPYAEFKQGFVQGACTPSWNASEMPGWNVDWTVNAFEEVTEEGLQCDRWVNHPVLIVQRDTFANFFHGSEDLVNSFLAMCILNWTRGDTQVYVTDLYPEGPFWDMWSRVFSGSDPPKKALTAWDLSLGPLSTGRTCFRSLAVGIFGPASPITVAKRKTPCRRTALVRAYSDYVVRGMGLQEKSRYASKKTRDKKAVNITFVVRRSSQWPEKCYCDDKASFFDCGLFEQLEVRELKRQLKNEHSIVLALKTLIGEKLPNGAYVASVQAVDYNLLTFEEQILVDMDTDIMIGPHGAGLMHSVFMPDRAALVELFIDNSYGNNHFQNLASWYGRSYIKSGPVSNPVPEREILQWVYDAIAKLDLDQVY